MLVVYRYFREEGEVKTMTKLEYIIKKSLSDTVDHCEFKKAWLPNGWAVVNIKTFPKELAKIIENNKNNI